MADDGDWSMKGIREDLKRMEKLPKSTGDGFPSKRAMKFGNVATCSIGAALVGAAAYYFMTRNPSQDSWADRVNATRDGGNRSR